ncbi:MAG: MFS transporter [Rhodobacteraceae bacterium]|jgi:predicted MFS family arabinose efflux permease|nr:MFS transporter [Paracoccaceae bacterium]
MRHPLPMLEILGPGPYRTYTLGNAISLIGTWMQRITVGYLTWELTGSAAWLGLMSMADLCPTLLVSPLAGVMADRLNRHMILRLTQALGLVQAALMAILYETAGLTVGVMLVFTFALGVVNGVAQPARLTMISALVSRDRLGTAVAVNAINFNLARFTGPAAAGVLISTAGVGWAFVANALSYGAFLWAMERMPDRVKRASPPPTENGLLRDLTQGFGFVLRNRGTLIVMLLMTVVSLFSRPVIELMPGFAAAVFGRGADGLAMLTAAIGLGAMAGGLWMASRRNGLQSRLMVQMALGGALFPLAFSCVSSLWLGLPLLAGAGCCWVCTSIAAQTLLQTGVADQVRGRVLALYGMVLKSGPALGALGVGMVSDRIGLQTALLVSAALSTSYVLLQFLLIPRIRADLEAAPHGPGSEPG